MPGKERMMSLVRAAQAGDDLAFAELVRSYQNMAVAYANSILGDYHLAEDASQEAFVDAYRELSSLREPAAFAAWFRTILFKHCDRLTRRKRHPITGLNAAFEVASPHPSPHETLESQDAQTLVRDAVSTLSDSERAVVLLYYMSEHSHATIAEFLGVTSNTVKTRLYSARQRLRKHMRYLEEDFEAARPSSNPRFAGRVLSATLPLQLYFIDDDGSKQAAGSTVASRTADVPASETWLIEPRRTLNGKDWDTIIGLVKDMHIPGLGATEQMTDALLERISKLDHLTYLDLHDSGELTDTGLRHLARLPQLQHLNLSCHQITDHGLEVLRHLPQLKSFEIYHQGQVSDAGLANLAHCDHLERVNLMGTETGDGVIQALTGKAQLREFFAGTKVTDAGLKLFHQFPVFKTWRGGRAAMSLMSFLAHPNYLWLNLKAPLTNKGLQNLAGLEGLYALNLFGTTGHAPFEASNTAITPAGLSHLAGLPNLGWLACCAQLCTDDAMRHIRGMPRLRFLMCQDAVAGDDGFLELGRSPSIEYIWGRRCYNLTGRGFAALRAMPSLRGLAVSCRNVDDEGLSALPRFPALREFMPMDVADDGFRHVGRCQQLEALHCMYCPGMTDTATGYLAGLSNLKSYQVWGAQITDRSLEILGRMSSLEHLRFYRCDGITNGGLVSLADLPRLREVDLEGLRSITPEGAAVFPAQIHVNYSA
ncbi:MAG: sigma-70 family RNA polymerase sigma factor [Acidobacteriia bacterium]|nr:sigma-70 family RNA polymerase sigma factor [Terriglobia bacterium]